MVRVCLPDNTMFLMDAEDWANLPFPRTLTLDQNGYPLMEVYCEQTRNTEHVHLHRWILRNPEGKVVDHKSGVRFDVRKENLRVCTYQQNALNRKPVTLNFKGEPKASQYKGVVYRANRAYRSPWVARVQVPGEGRRIKSRHFKTEREAALGYNEMAKEYYGEFAYLNEVL